METNRYDVVVVGAGFAGLSVANRLKKTGLRVLVLEARDRIGGRAFSAPFHGRLVDLGGGWVAPEAQEEIGALVEQSDCQYASDDEPLTYQWRAEDFQTENECPFTQAEKRAIEAQFAQRPVVQDATYDASQNFQTWFADVEVSREKRMIVEGFVSNALNADVDDISLLNIDLGLENYERNIWTAHDGLNIQIDGGMNVLSDYLSRGLSEDIRLSHPVTSVGKTSSGEFFWKCANGQAFISTYGVVAIPVNTIPQITWNLPLPQAVEELAQYGNPGSGLKIWCEFSEDAAGQFILNSTGPIYKIRINRAENGRALGVAIGNSATLKSSTDIVSLLREIKSLTGAKEIYSTRFHDWATDPYSRGGWYACPPGAEQWLLDEQKHTDQLFFAGADLNVDWNGWFEGALLSARDTAEQILKLL